jgi:putative hydrolase of the HAD superfamily
MQLAYDDLCKDVGRIAEEGLSARILAEIGAIFVRPELYPDAVVTLEQLRPQYMLGLLTKGNERVQNETIDDLALRPYFDAIQVVPTKGAREFTQMLDALGAHVDAAWAVGNSVRSDVIPALQAGLRAVLIPRGTWRYEEAPLVFDGVPVVDSLQEAAAVIQAADAQRRRTSLPRGSVPTAT